MNQSKKLEELSRECCVTGRAYRNALKKVAQHILRAMRPHMYPCGYSSPVSHGSRWEHKWAPLQLAVLRKPFYVYLEESRRARDCAKHTHISEVGFIDAEGHGCVILGWDHYGQRVLLRLARHIEQHGFKTAEERRKAA